MRSVADSADSAWCTSPMLPPGGDRLQYQQWQAVKQRPLWRYPASAALPPPASPWLSPSQHTGSLSPPLPLSQAVTADFQQSWPLSSLHGRNQGPCNDLAGLQFQHFDTGPVTLSRKPSESRALRLGRRAVSGPGLQRGVHLLLFNISSQGNDHPTCVLWPQMLVWSPHGLFRAQTGASAHHGGAPSAASIMCIICS